MINKPTVSELLEKSENRYELVIATSKRARQLANGRIRLINTEEESPVTIAANEIAQGKVKIVDESELSKNSDQLLREQEAEELRQLEMSIKKQLEETKKLEEEVFSRVNKNHMENHDEIEKKIEEDTKLNEEVLSELMGSKNVMDTDQGFSEVEEEN